MQLSSSDIVGVVGIVPTPGTPDAGRWDAENTVDLVQTEKMVAGIVDAGTNIIMTTGTFGQCATLLWEELRDFVDCVVQTTAKRRPVFAGVTTLNTRETIRRGRGLLDVGADGLFIGRPMWIGLDDQGIVQYYRDLAAAFAGTPIVIYDNPAAFKGPISNTVYAELAQIPEIIASKHVSGPTLEPHLATFGDKLRILPYETHWAKLARKYPETALACWSGGVACGPAPVTALARAVKLRDWDAADAISEKINWALEPMYPPGGLERYMDYSIQLGHVRFAAAGFIDPGPTRPPYVGVLPEFVDGAREAGTRWRSLQEAYFQQPSTVA